MLTVPSDLTAILVGCSVYPQETGLDSIPPVANNIRKLANILADPDIFGIPDERIHTLLDPESCRKFNTFIKTNTAEAQGTLLFYYAGHGIIAYDGSLLFPTQETEKSMEDETSVAWELVKRRLISSPARRRILILDCCYSGRATGSLGAETAELRAPLAAEGAIAITAAPRNKTAHFLAGEDYTAFSGRLFTVLEYGIPDRGGLLTADAIFEETRRLVSMRGNLPEPQIVASGTMGQLPIARNKAVAVTRDTVWRAGYPNEDAEWIAQIREHTARIAGRFAATPHAPMNTNELQSLAGPIRKWAVKLSRLEFVEELLNPPEASGANRDAAVFAGSVIAYEKRAGRFVDQLMELAGEGHTVRGCAIWRVLRAIKRLRPEIELSPERQERLLRALINCARHYDSKPGSRFSKGDVVSLVRDIAKRRDTGLTAHLGQIFNADQLRELTAATAQRPGLAAAPAPDHRQATIPQSVLSSGGQTTGSTPGSSLWSLSSGILAERVAETENILSSLSGFTAGSSRSKFGKDGS